jgi:hypothetical protein
MLGNRNSKDRITKCQYERILDESGFPEDVPHVKRQQAYGNWLRKYHPARFDAAYEIWEAEEAERRGIKYE